MERAVFLLEADGIRIPCLLNPENLLIRRTAGVRARGLTHGPMAAGALPHDPLLYTGGGRTELTMYLVFDVSLVTPPIPVATTGDRLDGSATNQPLEDVRELTRPLLALAEARNQQDTPCAPVARFFWGKAWNIAGVVTAIAERLEYFTAAGIPRRSWVSMRFVQVQDDQTSEPDDDPLDLSEMPVTLYAGTPIDERELQTHDVLSDGLPGNDNSSAERPDQIADMTLGHPSRWRPILQYNDIDDPLESLAGRTLLIPPRSATGTLA
jgi:hypothetical protein